MPLAPIELQTSWVHLSVGLVVVVVGSSQWALSKNLAVETYPVANLDAYLLQNLGLHLLISLD